MANEEAKPTPTVCVCGYDLAGLAIDADAKCPECGVHPPTALAGRAKKVDQRTAAVMAFGPTGLWVVCVVLAAMPSFLILPLVLAAVGGVVAFLWLFTLTPIACVGWVQYRYAWLPEWYQGLLSLVVVVGVVAVNAAAAGVTMLIARVIFF